MRTIDALGKLQRFGVPVIATGEAITLLNVTPVRASQILRALAAAGLVTRLRHGLWLLQANVDPFVIPPYLTAPYPAYVSLWSALSRHGMIEQIPRQIFVASLDRPRRVKTSLGQYSIHHFVPEVFGTGLDGSFGGSLDAQGYLATPEKALFDTVYLQAARRKGVHLPELELTADFAADKLAQWTARIATPWLRTLTERGLDQVIAAAVDPSNELLTSAPPSTRMSL